MSRGILSEKAPVGQIDSDLTLSDGEKWFKAEQEKVVESLNKAKERVRNLDSKLDQLAQLTEAQKERRCIRRLKSAFKRRYTIYDKLVDAGDDVVNGQREGMRPHRLQPLVNKYCILLDKFKAALKEAETLQKDYPAAAEKGEYSEWEMEVPDVRGEGGSHQILTTAGVTSVNLLFDQ